MATPLTQAKLHALIADNAPQAVDEALSASSMLWNLFPKIPCGARIDWQVKTASNSVSSGYTHGSGYGSAGAASTTQASLYLGNYSSVIGLTDFELDAAAFAGDRFKVGELMRFQLADAASEMAQAIHTGAISGSTHASTNGTVIGTTGGMVEDDNSYGGINRGSVAAHAPYVNDNSGTPRAVSTTLLGDVIDTVRDRNGNVNIGLTSQAQFNAIAALTGVSETKNDLGGMGIAKFVGVETLYVKGVPLIAVPGYTAGRVDFLDTNYVAWRFLPSRPTSGEYMLGDAFKVTESRPTSGTSDVNCTVVRANVQLQLRNGFHRAASLQDLS